MNSASNRIFLIEKERKNKDKKIKNIMENSKHVFFLGFGFDDYNLSLLGNKWFETVKTIGGTCMGISSAKMDELERSFRFIVNECSWFKETEFDLDPINDNEFKLYFKNCDVSTFINKYLKLK